MESWSVVAQDEWVCLCGGGDDNGAGTGFGGGWIRMLFISVVVIISWMYTYAKLYQIPYLKYMQFVVCEVYLT